MASGILLFILLASSLYLSPELSATDILHAVIHKGSTHPVKSAATSTATNYISEPGKPIPTAFLNKESDFAQVPTWGINFAIQPDGPVNPKMLHFDIGNTGYGSNQLQDYTNSTANIRISNGKLIIQALNQSENGSPYTSARLTTEGIHNFTYGKMDIVAENPAGDGTWPAIWLMSANQPYAKYPTVNGVDPYYNSGEIDIAESTGAQPGQIYSILQSQDSNYYASRENDNIVTVPTYATAFHDYGVEWTPTSISFTLDGTVTYTLNKNHEWNYSEWPYTSQNPFYLVINLAIGDGWVGHVNNASLPATMQIKSMVYWRYTGQSS